jgi:hypothetical protein
MANSSRRTSYLLIWRTGLVPAAIVGGAMLAAIAAHRAIFALAKRDVQHKVGQLIESIVRYGDAPSRLIMPLLAVLATLPWLAFTNTTGREGFPWTLPDLDRFVGMACGRRAQRL